MTTSKSVESLLRSGGCSSPALLMGFANFGRQDDGVIEQTLL